MSTSDSKFTLLVVFFVSFFIVISDFRIKFVRAHKRGNAYMKHNIGKHKFTFTPNNNNSSTMNYAPLNSSYPTSKDSNSEAKQNMAGEEKNSFSWSSISSLWDHINTTFETGNYDHSFIENTDYDYNYNYEDLWLPSNGKKLDNFDDLKGLRSYFVQQEVSNDSAKNHSDLKAVNPFLSFPNITNNLNLTDYSPFFHPSLYLGVNSISRKKSSLDFLSSPIKEQKYPPWENLTTEQRNSILNMTLGSPQKHSITVTTGLTIYYGILLLVGIPGNGLTCLIILTNSYMRTAPNIFIFNIALADQITLITGKSLEHNVI